MTLRHLEHIAGRINNNLVNKELIIGRRYNYHTIDVYDKYKKSMVKTLLTGTKKKIGIYLLAFEESAVYSRFLR